MKPDRDPSENRHEARVKALADLMEAPALSEILAEVRALRAEVAELRACLPSPLVTVERACELLGISESTARRWIRDGELPVVKRGGSVRVDLSQVKAKPANDIEVARAARKARDR